MTNWPLARRAEWTKAEVKCSTHGNQLRAESCLSSEGVIMRLREGTSSTKSRRCSSAAPVHRCCCSDPQPGSIAVIAASSSAARSMSISSWTSMGHYWVWFARPLLNRSGSTSANLADIATNSSRAAVKQVGDRITVTTFRAAHAGGSAQKSLRQ